MAPHHYFNVTIYGLRHLCRQLDIIETGAFGTLAENWNWIGREAGGHLTLGEPEFARIQRAMERLDNAMTPEQKQVTAPAVSLLGVRR